ncbi:MULTISPECIES: hypothetical protein [unclassified Streptomyces]|uniref:hypothetical protein n=1 Tax=Streptomyces TaxID=1883 RepID=UPI0008239636|nr:MULTISPECIES: hypothetical protein [unclassified Streptomyces]AWN30567.1 hypothetical protein DKG71_34585 [Streptomyces sp. NEAU-S7GS2]MYT15683.1 hypothetical protein [Streptomyces sp. SID4951]SCK23800.1 hypothetical protein YWIDRAFT_05152 [Streptomyces sp. SceaMP-e96]
MSKIGHETGPQGELVCPACKQPLTTTVKRRHKTCGIFVPVWATEPCRNPECPEYLEAPERTEHLGH